MRVHKESSPKKVMIVEDEEALNESVARLVIHLGCTPVQVFDGDKALRAFEMHKPDLCLVDVLLPGQNGLQVCRAIRGSARGASVPIILTSSSFRDTDEIESTKEVYGADDYLAKPFRGETLLKLLEKWLSKSEEPGLSKSSDGSVGNRVSSPSSQPRLSVPAHGRLEDVEVGRLLKEIFMAGKTGSLSISSRGITRELFFIDGQPVYARSNTLSEALGTLLVQRNLATTDQINHAVQSRQNYATMGQQLISDGVITEQELLETLNDQVRDRILACFAVRQGTYRFEEGHDFVQNIQIYRQNPIGLIREGIERHQQINAFATQLQEWVDKYIYPTSECAQLVPHFPVEPAEEVFIESIDGTVTLGELMQRQLLDVTASLKLVWCLWATGIIEFNTSPSSKPMDRMAEREPQVKAPPMPIASEPAVRIVPEEEEEEILELEDEIREPVDEEESDAELDRQEEEREALRRLVLDTHLRLGKDLYQILDIDRAEGHEAIATAAADLLQVFAPGKTDVLSSKDRIKAAEIYAAVLSAQNILSDRELRTQYDASLKRRKSPVGASAEYHMSKGAVAYGVALAAMESGDWPKAVDQLNRAIEYNHDEIILHADLAWARFNNNEIDDHTEVKAVLLELLSKDPHNSKLLYYLGGVEAKAGDGGVAKDYLCKALAYDADNKRAQVLLDELETNQKKEEKAKENRSFWSQLFGD